VLPIDNIINFYQWGGVMPKKEIPTVANYFESVTDPRRENRRHKLIDIITKARLCFMNGS
jgi:hypothetical protein